MYRYFILLSLLFGCMRQHTYAQISRDAAIGLLYDQDMYSKIVDVYARDTAGLSGDSYKYIGLSYYFSDNSDTLALHFLAKALEVGCSNQDAVVYYLGQSCRYTKDYSQAKAYYRSLLQRNPRHASSYVGLGYCMLFEKKTDQACQMFENAYIIDNTHLSANLNLGIYGTDLKKCRIHLANVLKYADSTDYHFIRSLYYLALMDRDAGGYAEADRKFFLAKRLDPDDPDILEGIIQSLYMQERYTAAEPYKRELYRLCADTASNCDRVNGYYMDDFGYKKYRVLVQELSDGSNAVAGKTKVRFSVYNEYNRLLYKINLEYTLADSAITGEDVMHLGLVLVSGNNNRVRHGSLFARNYDYGGVKSAVIDIIKREKGR